MFYLFVLVLSILVLQAKPKKMRALALAAGFSIGVSTLMRLIKKNVMR